MEKVKLANGQEVNVEIRKSIVLDGKKYYTDKEGMIVGENSELIDYLQAKGNHRSEWELIADGQYQALSDIHQTLQDFEEYLEDSKRISRKNVEKFVEELRNEVNGII